MPLFFSPDNAALQQLNFISLPCYTLKLFVIKHLLWAKHHLEKKKRQNPIHCICRRRLKTTGQWSIRYFWQSGTNSEMLWAVVSVTHRETLRNSWWKATNKQSLPSPHPAVLFHGQQSAILFSRKGWKIWSQSCVAVLPPWAMAQTKVAPEGPGGDGGVCPVTGPGEHWARGQSHTQKFVSAWPSAAWGFLSASYFSILIFLHPLCSSWVQ